MYLEFGRYSNEVNGYAFDKERFRSSLFSALYTHYDKCSLCRIGNGSLEFRLGYVGNHVFTFSIYYTGFRVSVSEVSDPTLYFEDSCDKLSEKCDKYVEDICNSLCDMYGVSLITK